jgi:hypothetical protein
MGPLKVAGKILDPNITPDLGAQTDFLNICFGKDNLYCTDLRKMHDFAINNTKSQVKHDIHIILLK